MSIEPALSKKLKLTVVTPEKVILDSVEVEELLVPGARGEMGILPIHAPLVSSLKKGILKYRIGQKNFKEISLSWGYCEVQVDKVVILAESANF